MTETTRLRTALLTLSATAALVLAGCGATTGSGTDLPASETTTVTAPGQADDRAAGAPSAADDDDDHDDDRDDDRDEDDDDDRDDDGDDDDDNDLDD